jgi:hypothetical protein
MHSSRLLQYGEVMEAVIGLVGFAGSGKDTVGQYLVEHFGYKAQAFADPLKDCLCSIFGWDRDMLSGRTPESRLWREEIDTWWADKLGIPHFTPRFAMQNFGTDIMRRMFHDEVWLINMEKRLLEANGPVVVTDGRFSNEIRMMRRLGGRVYRVRRGPDPVWMDIARLANEGDQLARQRLGEVFKVHQSEWAWVGENLDGSIRNDGDIDDLYERCNALFRVMHGLYV